MFDWKMFLKVSFSVLYSCPAVVQFPTSLLDAFYLDADIPLPYQPLAHVCSYAPSASYLHHTTRTTLVDTSVSLRDDTFEPYTKTCIDQSKLPE